MLKIHKPLAWLSAPFYPREQQFIAYMVNTIIRLIPGKNLCRADKVQCEIREALLMLKGNVCEGGILPETILLETIFAGLNQQKPRLVLWMNYNINMLKPDKIKSVQAQAEGIISFGLLKL